MKCADCRFSLLCYMGRLGAGTKEEIQGDVLLCPKCGKLVYTPSASERSVYTFFCEQRPVSPAIKKKWAKLMARLRDSKRAGIATFLVYDPGPGLIQHGGKLRVAECLSCCQQLSLAPGIVWHDLDEDDCTKAEQQPHAFGLRYGKKRKSR